MKRYLKNAAILVGILIAEINVFFLGKDMLDKAYNVGFSLSGYDDIVSIIFNSGSYKNINLQIWFIAAFAFFLFVYINVFISQILETPKYRSLKLYRYGKDKYLYHCKKSAVVGNLCGIFTILLGIIIIGLILTMQGRIINFNGTQGVEIGLQLLKLFLISELYGTINIYCLLRANSSHVLVFSMVAVFMQLVIESFGDTIHLLTISDINTNVYYVIGLVVVNIAADLFFRWSAKRNSMC